MKALELTVILKLVQLTNRNNDDVKIVAISALGDYQATVKQQLAIFRLIELCDNSNKNVAISAINALSKLAIHFNCKF